MPPSAPSSASSEILEAAICRLESSTTFARATSQVSLLRYLATQTMLPRVEPIRESDIGVDFFGREPGYDTGNDAIVRVNVSRLRAKLERYYQSDGADDVVRLSLPVGTYALRVEHRERPTVPTVQADEHAVAAATPGESRSGYVLWAGLCAVATVLIAALGLHFHYARQKSWLDQALQVRSLTPGDGSEAFPAFSPDGEQIVYSSRSPDAPFYRLAVGPVRSMDAPHLLLTPAGDALHAEWSPDGKRLAYLLVGPHDSEIEILDLASGVSRSVAHLPWYANLSESPFTDSRVPGPTWTPDGMSLLFALRSKADGPESLVLLNLSSGNLTPLTTAHADEEDGTATVSPDGKLVAFLRKRSPVDCDVDLLDLQTHTVRTLAAKWGSVNGLTWNPNGRELIVAADRGQHDRPLWRLSLAGKPRFFSAAIDAPYGPVFSPTQPLIALTSRNPTTTVVLMPKVMAGISGKPLFPATEHTRQVSLSPDGMQIAFLSDRSGSGQVWAGPAEDTKKARQLTADLPAQPLFLAWAPDGRRLAMVLRGAGQNGIRILDTAGQSLTKLATPCLDREVLPLTPTWSEDGSAIFFSVLHGPQTGIYRASAGGPPSCERLSSVATHKAIPGPDHYFYFAALRGAGFFRVRVGSDTPQSISQLALVQCDDNWTMENGDLLYIDMRAAVRRLERFSPRTGKTEPVSAPLERVAFDGFSYSPSRQMLLFHQHNEPFISRILALQPRSPLGN